VKGELPGGYVDGRQLLAELERVSVRPHPGGARWMFRTTEVAVDWGGVRIRSPLEFALGSGEFHVSESDMRALLRAAGPFEPGGGVCLVVADNMLALGGTEVPASEEPDPSTAEITFEVFLSLDE